MKHLRGGALALSWMSQDDRLTVAALLLACAAACTSESGGAGGAGGSTVSSSSSSAASGATTSSVSASSTTIATSSSGGGEGGAGDGGATATGGAGTGGMTVDPSICAAQLTEEDCQAAGCNAWLAYYELTVTLDQCESQVVGPLCMNYTEPGGPTAWGAFARLFEADVPEVLGRGNLAVPDGWVRCGEPGSEGLRACCCYTNPFPDDTCAGVQSDLP